MASVRAYPSVDDVPDDVDLAIFAMPAGAVPAVIDQCARKRVRGPGRHVRRVRRLRARVGKRAAAGGEARANGMRVIGPNCLGIMNTDPAVLLNATLGAVAAPPGRVGLLLPVRRARDRDPRVGAAARGIGLSTFVSAGDRADVSGNDLLQYWEDDPATDVVLLHLETFGNPRKFARLARRVGRTKPIVAVKSGGTVAARLGQTADPERAVDALFHQAGVIRVDTLAQLFDVAQVLTTQPLPRGRRVAVIGNSLALARLAAEACAGNGLEVAPLSESTRDALRTLHGDALVDNPLLLLGASGPDDLARALDVVLADDAIDAVVTVFVPPLRDSDLSVAEVLAAATTDTAKPSWPHSWLSTPLPVVAHDEAPRASLRVPTSGRLYHWAAFPSSRPPRSV